MSLGVFAFRLGVSTKHRRKIVSPAPSDIPLDLLITQSGENIHTQDALSIALEQRIVRLLLTENLNTIITQNGDFIDTTSE